MIFWFLKWIKYSKSCDSFVARAVIGAVRYGSGGFNGYRTVYQTGGQWKDWWPGTGPLRTAPHHSANLPHREKSQLLL